MQRISPDHLLADPPRARLTIVVEVIRSMLASAGHNNDSFKRAQGQMLSGMKRAYVNALIFIIYAAYDTYQHRNTIVDR